MAKKGSLFSLSDEHKQMLQLLTEMSSVKISMTTVLEELIEAEYKRKTRRKDDL